MDDHSSALATREHIDRLVRKRDTLNRAIEDAFDQVVMAVARAELRPSECVDWWQWARALGVLHASGKMTTAVGHVSAVLRQWMVHPPDAVSKAAGEFPPEHWAEVPPNGRPSVYLLLDDSGTCIYVGCSRMVRSRLKTHRREGTKLAASWEVILCLTEQDARQLEADLIFQHQPMHNQVRRSSRGYIRHTSDEAF